MEPVRTEPPEGWASWAWSYVPELVYYEDENDEETALNTSMTRKRPNPILAVGFYCRKMKVIFKV